MVVETSELEIEVNKKKVHCALTQKRDSSPAICIVIGHGASGDLTSGNLPSIAKSLAEAGFSVLRYNAAGHLPARIKILEGLLSSNHAKLKNFEKWVLSGHSMGGRTACAVAITRKDVAAVVLLSYPLHPPGKPDQLRDEDLTALQLPILLVKGSKDAFSTTEPWEAVLSRMASSDVEVELVEKGDHSLNSKTGIGKERYNEWIRKVIEFLKKHTQAVRSDIEGAAGTKKSDKPKSKKRKR